MLKKVSLMSVCLALLATLGANLAFAQTPTSEHVGEVILLSGQVLDVKGDPIAGASVEIWQADANGVYNYPEGGTLDPNFQYFGTSVTDADGMYSFRTIKPAWYEASRPPHIHVKVKIDGVEALTTQFYFEEDRALFENDSIFAETGDNNLVLQAEDGTDENGDAVRLAEKDLVVVTDSAASGSLTPTTAQTEGPYYPVVDVSEYDNDLTVVGDPTASVEMPEFTLLNMNTSSGDDFLTIPSMSNRMVREFQEYRPYVSIVQFRREIGKYVDEAQVAAYEAYVYVPVDVDESDAETLKQIPGVDDDIANALIAARPFGSNEAFLTALAGYVSEAEAAFAANYLAE